MRSNSPASRVAHVEDADDNGFVKPGGERTYARSVAPSSPTKEKPNTGRSRRESRVAGSISSDLTDGDSISPPSSRKESKKRSSRDDRKSSSKSKANVAVKKEKDMSQRPPPRSSRTTTDIHSRSSESPSYFGVPHDQVVAVSGSRPRHTRPASYQGHAQPPLSRSAFYQPPHLPPPSFPPPSFIGGPPPRPLPVPHQIPYPPGRPTDYPMQSRSLSARFGDRPQSAMGHRQYSSGYDEEPTREKSVSRRSSVSRKTSSKHEDRLRMPPPQRPSSARPPEHSDRLVLRPSPRKSVGFDETDSTGDGQLYQHDYGRAHMERRSRRDSFGDDSNVDLESYRQEPASRSRRNSHYNVDDKYHDVYNTAAQYQAGVNGSGALSLTADTLQHVKNGGSSRSTRSSASRDESDWKHSATTGYTRSSSADDDITITVPNGAVIEVNNTKIHCGEGAGMTIGRGGASRGGSDRATSIYEDERTSRSDRRMSRTRAPSQPRLPEYPRALPYPQSVYSEPFTAAPYASHAPFSGLPYPRPSENFF
jgi:hypothetical protein